jgi:hypothetical protein
MTMSQWLPNSPGTGDTAGISALSTLLDVAVGQLSEAGDQLRSRRPAQIYRAEFLSAFDQSADPYLTQLTGVGDALVRISNALAVYSAAVSSISAQAGALLRQRLTANATVASTGSCLLDAQQQPKSLTSNALVRQYRNQLQVAQDSCTRITAAMDTLAEERRTADAAVLSALQGESLITSWCTTGAALAAGGLTRPDLITTDTMIQALMDLSQDVIAGKASEDDVAALTAYLDALRTDPRSANAYFDALGGQRTAELIDALGDAATSGALNPTAALDLAVAVQALLSVASADWDTDRADQFTTEMLQAIDAAGAIGFLFGDPTHHPMGETFTLAMLDELDRNERINGNIWGSGSPGGGNALANLQGLSIPGRASDPVSAVLETLGQYPDAALAWLSQDLQFCPADGQLNRIEYWFGERSWDSDGYQGIGALWSGIQRATGADLTESYDPEAWRQLQTANAHIWEALALNDHFDVQTASEFGATYLTDAIKAQLTIIGAITTVGDTSVTALDPTNPLLEVAMPGVGTRWIPLIPDEYLYRVLGVAASYQSTYDDLHAAISAMQDDLATASGPNLVADLQFVLGLQAIADGVSGGSDLAAAAARDATMSQSIDTAAAVLDLATSLKVSNPVAGLVVSGIIGAAQDKATSWTATYDDVRSSTTGQNSVQRDTVTDAVREFANANFTDTDWEQARASLGKRAEAPDEQVVNGYANEYEKQAEFAQNGAQRTAQELRDHLIDQASGNSSEER